MFKKILDKIESLLESESDFLVAVKKVWHEVQDEIELDELIGLLKKDKRFKVYESKNEPWEGDNEAEMEKLGYYLGPRVMLVSRTPTKEEMAKSLADKMQKMANNLQKAYDAKPDDLEDNEEEQLLEAMKKAKELRENIDKAFGE